MRRRRGAALLLSSFLLAAACARPSPPSDTDARIRFYEQRLGGRGTYPAYARLGVAYLRKARETGDPAFYGRSEYFLTQSLSMQRNYEAILGLSALSLGAHQFDQAVGYAEEAVETMPSDPDAHAALVDAQLAIGRVEDAAASADALLTRSQGFQALARVAMVRAARDDNAGARELMERARQSSERESLPAETRAWVHVQLAGLHATNCDTTAAEREIQHALEHLPGYPAARAQLASLHASAGRTAEAIAAYEELSVPASDLRYRIALADLYEVTGQPDRAQAERDRALSELRRAVARGSRTEVPVLARLLLEHPATAAEGLMLAQNDAAIRRDVLAADNLAWAYYRNHRYEDAADSLPPLVTAAQGPRVAYHAAMIRWRAGDAIPSRALLERALSCAVMLTPAERQDAEAALRAIDDVQLSARRPSR